MLYVTIFYNKRTKEDQRLYDPRRFSEDEDEDGVPEGGPVG